MLAELGLNDISQMPSSAVVCDLGGAPRVERTLNISECRHSKNEPIILNDTLDLSNELRQAAEQCQIIAEKIKRKGDHCKQALEENKSNCCQELKSKYKETTAELIKLKQVIKDVTDINKRWQKYNGQQQEYIQRLLETNKALQQEKAEAEVAAILKADNETINTRKQPLSFRHSDSSLMNNSDVMSQLRHSYESAVKDSCRLQKELEECQIREEVLKIRLAKMADSHKEELQLLEMQIKTNKEDWQAEKVEKMAEIERANRMQEKAMALELECRSYAERLSVLQRTCDNGNSFDEMIGWRMLRRHRSSSPSSYSNRRIVVDNCEVVVPDDHSEPRLISRGSYENANPIDHSNAATNDRLQIVELVDTNNDVTCPGCLKHFTSQQHIDFVEHFEKCQK